MFHQFSSKSFSGCTTSWAMRGGIPSRPSSQSSLTRLPCHREDTMTPLPPRIRPATSPSHRMPARSVVDHDLNQWDEFWPASLMASPFGLTRAKLMQSRPRSSGPSMPPGGSPTNTAQRQRHSASLQRGARPSMVRSHTGGLHHRPPIRSPVGGPSYSNGRFVPFQSQGASRWVPGCTAGSRQHGHSTSPLHAARATSQSAVAQKAAALQAEAMTAWVPRPIPMSAVPRITTAAPAPAALAPAVAAAAEAAVASEQEVVVDEEARRWMQVAPLSPGSSLNHPRPRPHPHPHP